MGNVNEDDFAKLETIRKELTENLGGVQFIQRPSDLWSTQTIQFLSCSVLAFTLLTLMLCTVLLWKKDAKAQLILKVFGLITIIGVSAVLLIVGYNHQQLTPVIGLFGAIAGYLLGKETPNE